jgi:hypothetical protein
VSTQWRFLDTVTNDGGSVTGSGRGITQIPDKQEFLEPITLVGPASKLTHTGRAWWTQKILSDGVRLYFVERMGGREFLVWAPIEGGEPVLIPTPFLKTGLLDISPDHTRLLLADFEPETEASL